MHIRIITDDFQVHHNMINHQECLPGQFDEAVQHVDNTQMKPDKEDFLQESTRNKPRDKTKTTTDTETLTQGMTSMKREFFSGLKRWRPENEETESQWNIYFMPVGGGIPQKSLMKYAEDEALDGMLQRHTKKSDIPKTFELTMCKAMVPGNFALGKWPIKKQAKELKNMETLKEFCSAFSPNKNGIIHPYVHLSSVKIPLDDFNEYVKKEFSNWKLQSKGFLTFSSSIGISKTQALFKGKIMVILTFLPVSWNKCGHRLFSSHCRKPEIIPRKCDLVCCSGKWSDTEWSTVLTQYGKKK